MYADDEALFLSTMKVFAIGHSPLRIPFKDISLSRKKVLLVSVGRLHFAKMPGLEIRMSAKDIAWIESIHGALKPNA